MMEVKEDRDTIVYQTALIDYRFLASISFEEVIPFLMV
jgi:hypothetical protein